MNHTIQLGTVQVEEATLADLCRQYRVRELPVFGSAARGEMRPDSDIDLLVEFIPEAKVDLFDYAGLMLDLSKLIGRKVDLVSKKGLKPLIRASILKDARLNDIVEAADDIAQVEPATFQASDLLRSAVVHKLSVIGEAAARLSDNLKQQNPQVSWSRIVGFRNILIHAYFGIDWDIVC